DARPPATIPARGTHACACRDETPARRRPPRRAAASKATIAAAAVASLVHQLNRFTHSPARSLIERARWIDTCCSPCRHHAGGDAAGASAAREAERGAGRAGGDAEERRGDQLAGERGEAQAEGDAQRAGAPGLTPGQADAIRRRRAEGEADADLLRPLADE